MGDEALDDAINEPVAYLAGPEVFLPDAIEIGQTKVAICRDHGIDAVFPFTQAADPPDLSAERGHEIFEECVRMMRRCNLVIANMTPFRGASMDAGTAIEVGYMFARRHPVFAYTNVLADYDTRVAADSLSVESFGFADNLMCEGPVWKSGAAIVRTDVEPGRLFTDLRGFVACVELAAARLRVAR